MKLADGRAETDGPEACTSISDRALLFDLLVTDSANIRRLVETQTRLSEMALEAEIADSQSGEIPAALMVERGARKRKAEGQMEQRMDVDEFRATIHEYAERLRCRLDNTSVPEAQWINCTDPQAR